MIYCTVYKILCTQPIFGSCKYIRKEYEYWLIKSKPVKLSLPKLPTFLKIAIPRKSNLLLEAHCLKLRRVNSYELLLNSQRKSYLEKNSE